MNQNPYEAPQESDVQLDAEQSIEHLEQVRLERLERNQRRMRRVTSVLWVIVFILVAVTMFLSIGLG